MKGVGSLVFIVLFGSVGFLCRKVGWGVIPARGECRTGKAEGECSDQHADDGPSVPFQCYHPAGDSAVGEVIKVYKNAGSAEACQRKCNKVHECTYFAYVPHSRKCRLYKKNPTKTGKEDGVITGPKKCQPSCFLLDTVYTATVLVSDEKFSPYDCQIWCTDTNACEYWTWEGASDGVNGTCHLITDEYAFRMATHFKGAVSGPRGMCEDGAENADGERFHCIHRDAVPKSAQEHKKVDDIRNFLDCRSLCEKSQAACSYWSYNTENRSCTLWKGDATDIDQGHPSFITGPRACNNYCVHDNTTIDGEEIASPKQKSTAYDCLMSCFHVQGCQYTRYEDSTHTCHYLGSDVKGGLLEKAGWSFGNSLFCD